MMANDEVPDPVSEAGVNVAVAPVGSPLTLKVTVPEYPPRAVCVTV
jgi:hypothetical protein